jgi:hypothetical protein
MLKEIDYQTATDELKELLFDVRKVKIITNSQNLNNKEYDGILIENYVALINAESKKVLCVVSDQYQLFTNCQAINFGKKAFVQLFPSVKEEDLILYKVISNSRKTSCHIDLIHKNIDFTVWEQETWLPFVRITNSYNRTHKFSLELGFVRKLCSNGVIFNKKTIKVKYSHTKGDIPVSITVDVSKLKDLENEFKGSLLNLKRFHVNRNLSFPLICKALNLNWNLNENGPNYKNELNKFSNLKSKTKELTDVYINLEGETAFAIMNVMTDLVSHQYSYNNLPLFSKLANNYSYYISDWIEKFCEQAEKRDFIIEKYLGEFLKYRDN